MAFFTLLEIFYLLLTVAVVGFIFSGLIRQNPLSRSIWFNWEDLKFSMLVASPGIILHELSHKFVALSYGFDATYQIWTLGLFLGVVLKLFSSPFILLAPGYVSISQASQGIHTSLIAFAGPAVNLLLWLGARSILHSSRSFSQKQLLGLTLLRDINRWLFIFNIIPIPPLDGSKILGPLLFSFF